MISGLCTIQNFEFSPLPLLSFISFCWRFGILQRFLLMENLGLRSILFNKKWRSVQRPELFFFHFLGNISWLMMCNPIPDSSNRSHLGMVCKISSTAGLLGKAPFVVKSNVVKNGTRRLVIHERLWAARE